MKWQLRFRTGHFFLLITAFAILTAFLAPVIIRHYQTPMQRFKADLALSGYESPKMVAHSKFAANNHVGLCIYYTLAYRRGGKYLLRHVYFDPAELWYVRNFHPLTSDILKRFGHANVADLNDRLFDRRPTEEELMQFTAPLRKIIDKPVFMPKLLD